MEEWSLLDLRRFGDNVALLDDTKDISYSELKNISDQIATAVDKRCLVFLLAENSVEAIAGYIGFLTHKIVPMMIDANLDDDLLASLEEKYTPSFIWLPASRKDLFHTPDIVCKVGNYVLLKRKEAAVTPMNNNLALLMTTSGSTGSPKFVRLSYRNIYSNTEAIIKYLRIDSSERAITNLPLFYVYGLSIINTHLRAGASIVVTKSTMFDRNFWKIFRDKSVTNFGGVPYTYEMLKKLRFLRMDLPELRYMTQAGGKLAPELHRQFAEHASKTGKAFVVMYGAAEATSRMGYLPAEQSLDKVGCMGIAIPGGRFELIDDDGKIIQTPEQTGELVYYGDNVMMGYAESLGDLSKDDEYHGRYVTGDVAKMDIDGYYTVVGRKKRFLKMFGKRTNLQEVETILMRQFEGREFVCAGKDDRMYIFVTDDNIVDNIIPFIGKKLGIHHSGFVVRCIEEIPKNDAGKVMYYKLEQYYDL